VQKAKHPDSRSDAFVTLNYMLKTMHRKFAIILLSLACFAANSGSAQVPPAKGAAKAAPKPEENTLAHEIRHQLQVVPYYSVFDYITFTLEGGKVTLTGHVVRPTLRNDAEAEVKSIEGVTSVNNLIEVLPRSAADDDLRRAVYRAIFEDAELQRYAISEVPAIHIILKGGSVTLEGVVGSESEKNLATTRAGKVTGVSSLKNNLAVHLKEDSTN
jgi:hyperosmotically inducible protein